MSLPETLTKTPANTRVNTRRSRALRVTVVLAPATEDRVAVWWGRTKSGAPVVIDHEIATHVHPNRLQEKIVAALDCPVVIDTDAREPLPDGSGGDADA